MILYHGSKNGIKGEINPYSSREACDFGQGFYMGDMEVQPKGLIKEFPGHQFYELDCNFEGLKVLQFGNDYRSEIDWALFVAYNREPKLFENYEILKKRYEAYNKEYDVIVGLIADDQMTQAIARFAEGTINDLAFIESIKKVKLGSQYVLKSEKACGIDHVKVVSSRQLTPNEIKLARADENQRKEISKTIIQETMVRYRRSEKAKYFDEILEEWNHGN